MHFLFLIIAIVAEVIATSALKATDEFSRLWPTLLAIAGYICAFYFLTLALRVFPVGIAYAIWAGLGIVLVAIVGVVLYGQHLDLPAIVGIGLIIAGVLVINLLSKTGGH
jgi:small multidrug resistance pump